MRFGIVIVAGGLATRLPGKLTANAGALPLVARVLRNVRAAAAEVVVSTSAALAAEMRALVDVPVVVDTETARGPAGGMLAAFATMREPVIFAVAGDAPFIDAGFATRLAARWRSGDEALVPIHASPGGQPQSEPLAALYDRVAFLREAAPILRGGRGALRLVLEALATRYVDIEGDALAFTNVNTPEDFAALRAQLRARGESA